MTEAPKKKRGRPPKPKAPSLEQHERLQVAADLFNREIFGGTLPPVFVSLRSKPGAYGFFAPRRFTDRKGNELDLIALDAATAIERPLKELLSTLVHEMAHQAVYEQNNRESNGPCRGHGPAWRKLMDDAGLTPVQIGNSWATATHHIEPDGLFSEVFKANEAKLLELPWQEVGTKATRNRQDRCRFYCPICGQNAWAKPTAELHCGICSTDELLVAMVNTSAKNPGPDGSSRTTGGDYPTPVKIPGLPVFTDEMSRELRLHTGLDRPPTSIFDALEVLTFGLEQRGHGDLVTQLRAAIDLELIKDTNSDKSATLAALKAIWRLRAAQTHPDKGGSTVAFQSVQTAFLMLERSLKPKD